MMNFLQTISTVLRNQIFIKEMSKCIWSQLNLKDFIWEKIKIALEILLLKFIILK